MATRAQVHIIDTGVYLYQFLDGYNLPEEVQTALKLKYNHDAEYLTRIIFEIMLNSGKYDGWDATKEDKYRGQTLGFGIGIEQHVDIAYLIEVNVERQTISVKLGNEEMTSIWAGTFEQFIKVEIDEDALEQMVKHVV